MVRAKFHVVRHEITDSMQRDYSAGAAENSYKRVKLTTVVLHPVTSGSDENKAFFQSSPSGEIKLGTINPDAVAALEIGTEVYVDFTPAN